MNNSFQLTITLVIKNWKFYEDIHVIIVSV